MCVGCARGKKKTPPKRGEGEMRVKSVRLILGRNLARSVTYGTCPNALRALIVWSVMRNRQVAVAVTP